MRKGANATSTLNKFGCGNLSTLRKPAIKEHLIEFYGKYYSANLMRLTVYSHLPLQESEELYSIAFHP
jgi:secreted Zn-dependent insulinase-like peptidase